jgi:hypothetical protein
VSPLIFQAQAFPYRSAPLIDSFDRMPVLKDSLERKSASELLPIRRARGFPVASLRFVRARRNLNHKHLCHYDGSGLRGRSSAKAENAAELVLGVRPKSPQNQGPNPSTNQKSELGYTSTISFADAQVNPFFRTLLISYPENGIISAKQ